MSWADAQKGNTVIYVNLKGSVISFDECDKPLFDAHSWWVDRRGYVLTKIQRQDGTWRTVGLHRMILGDPDGDVDHMDRNRSNNSRSNLRACTRSENCRNVLNRVGKSSSYRGVSFNRGKWAVVVRINDKVKWIGSFATEEAAAAVAAPYFADIPVLTTHNPVA